MSKKHSRTSNPTIRPVKTDGVPLVEYEAVWQYILDHSLWTPYGYKVVFWVRNRAEWDWKIQSRMRGVYRVDEKLEEERCEKDAANFFITKKLNDRMGIMISKIDKGGAWYDKFALFIYRKTRDYIKWRTKTLPNPETSAS